MRDYQRQRVYDWEDEIVGPRDQTPPVPFDRAQQTISAIWLMNGLVAPPRVYPKSPRVTRTVASASRTEVLLPMDHATPTWIIIHEVTHSMMTTFDKVVRHKHDAAFVGMYMKLLEKHLSIPMPLLMYTATAAKVDFDLTAKPVVLE